MVTIRSTNLFTPVMLVPTTRNVNVPNEVELDVVTVTVDEAEPVEGTLTCRGEIATSTPSGMAAIEVPTQPADRSTVSPIPFSECSVIAGVPVDEAPSVRVGGTDIV